MLTAEDIKRLSNSASSSSTSASSNATVSSPKIELTAADIGRLGSGQAPLGYRPSLPKGTVIEAPKLPEVKTPQGVSLPKPQSNYNKSLAGRVNNFVAGSNVLTGISRAGDLLGNLMVKQAKEELAAQDELNALIAKGRNTPLSLKETLADGMQQLRLTAKSSLGLPSVINKPLAKFDETAQSTATKVFEQRQQEGRENFTQGMGETGKFLSGAAFSGADLLGKGVASAATGIPFLALSAMDGGSQAGQKALNEGYDSNKAAAMGIGSGAITAGIESLGGIGGNVGSKMLGKMGATAAGKALVGKLPTKAIDYIAKMSASKLGQIAGAAASEGVEEFSEYYAQNALENMVLDKDTPADIKEAMLNALAGALVGGVFGGGKAVINGRGQGVLDAQGVQQVQDVQSAQGISNLPTKIPQTPAAAKTPVTVGVNSDFNVVGNVNTLVNQKSILEPSQPVQNYVDDTALGNMELTLNNTNLPPNNTDLALNNTLQQSSIPKISKGDTVQAFDINPKTGEPFGNFGKVLAVNDDGSYKVQFTNANQATDIPYTTVKDMPAHLLQKQSYQTYDGKRADYIAENVMPPDDDIKYWDSIDDLPAEFLEDADLAYGYEDDVEQWEQIATKGKELEGNAKAFANQSRFENILLKNMADDVGYKGKDVRAQLKSDMREVSRELLSTGKLSKGKLTSIFNNMVDAAVVTLDADYQESKEVRQHLRDNPILINEHLKNDVTDLKDVVKSNFGRLIFTNDPTRGNDIDLVYNDILLDTQEGKTWDPDVSGAGDQLSRIIKYLDDTKKLEFTLEQYHQYIAGNYNAEVAHLRRVFDREVDQYVKNSRKTARYIEDLAAAKNSTDFALEITDNQAIEFGKELEGLRRSLASVERKTQLTKADRVIVDRLVKNEIAFDDIKNHENYNDIKKVVEVKQKIVPIENVLKDRTRAINGAIDVKTEQLIDQSYMEDFLPISSGKKLAYIRPQDVFEKLTRKMENGKEVAEKLNQEIIEPVIKATADRTRRRNELIKPISELEAKHKITKAEAILAYQVADGAADLNMDAIPADRAEVVQELADTIKQTLGKLLPEINTALVESGYQSKQGRADYMVHYNKTAATDTLGKLTELMGGTPSGNLPTDLAGRTSDFKPGRAYNQFLQERTYGDVDYNIGIMEAYERYVDSALDTIYYTKPIKTIRSLANNIRKKFSDAGVREQIDNISNDITLSDLEIAERVQALGGVSTGHMGTVVQWLDSYANMLANKKSNLDREVETEWGRSIYNFASSIENRITANMIAGNIRSGLTNTLAIAQGMPELKASSVLKASYDMMYNLSSDDGFVGRSDFLTSRRGSDSIGMYGANKVAQTITKPLNIFDDFASELMARAGAYEFGSEVEGSKWAASLIGDRSKGTLPMKFHSKNPFTKLFTMFQVEANNQFKHLGKTARKKYDESPIEFALYLTRHALYSYMANWIFTKYFGGQGPLFDPLGTIIELGEDIKDPKVSSAKTVTNLGANILEDVPFVGGFLGGGKFPINAALPNPANIINAIGGAADGTKSSERVKQDLGKELAKPVFYLLPSFGGGQLKKTIEGASTIAKGGEYTLDNKGQKQLKYLAGDSVADKAKLLVFGKSSTKNAGDYWDKGGNALTVKETKIVDGAKNQLIGRDKAYEIVTTIKGIEGSQEGADKLTATYNKRRWLMDNKDLKPGQKAWIDRQLFDETRLFDYSSEAYFEISNLGEDKLMDAKSFDRMGLQPEAYLQIHKGLKDVEGDKDPKTGATVPLSASKKKKSIVDKLVPKTLPKKTLEALYEKYGVSKQAW